MSSDLGECARTLVQAVFRLAFCDYIGSAYGHDEPGPDKWIRLNAPLQADAEKFLSFMKLEKACISSRVPLAGVPRLCLPVRRPEASGK